MPGFLINDAEWNALFDEPHHLLKVYCGIRRCMDFKTGIAGLERRLSEQMLRELLSTPASPGRPAHKASRKECRYAIDYLIRIGMLIACPEISPFVFRLPLASSDKSVSGRWGQRLAPGGAIGGALEEMPEAPDLQAFSGVDEEAGAAGFPEVGPEVGPTSGLPPNPPTSSSRVRAETDLRFPMHDDWTPSPRGWKATITRNGISPGDLTDERLMEFRSYWVNRPDKHQSQGQWEHELAQTIKRATRYEQAGRSTSHGPRTEQPEHSQAHRGPNQRGSLSAVDRVKADIARREAARQAAGAPMAEDDGALRPPLDVEFWRIS